MVGVQPDLLPLAWFRRPGFSQTTSETATRPTSCSSPATPRSATVSGGSRSRSPAPRARAATPRECPWVNGVFRSARSATAATSRLPVLRHRHRRAGLTLQRQGPWVRRVDLAKQRLGVVDEAPGHQRVEHAAGAPPHRVDRRLDPAEGVEQHRDPGQPGQPRPHRQVAAGQPGRDPATAPPSWRRGRRCAGPRPAAGAGRVLPHLAWAAVVKAVPKRSPRVTAASTSRARSSGGRLRADRQEGTRMSRRSAELLRPAATFDELVPEQPRRLVRVPGAADGCSAV